MAYALVRFVIDQTEMTSMLVSHDLVEAMLNIKEADDAMDESEKKVHRLQNLIYMEPYDASLAPNPSAV